MRRSELIATLIFLLSAATSTFTSGQPRHRPGKQVDSLFAEYDRSDSPGWAVLVVQDGEVLLRRGYGMANLEHQISITPSTVFDIATVSKQFAGMAISMLVEGGNIALYDNVREYIPELPDFGHKITIRHLVPHLSGMRDWPGTLVVAGWRMDDVISFDQILTFAYNRHDLNFKPGAEYSYSITGFNILAKLVECVSGESFGDWTHSQIFEPLGMHNTHFHDDYAEVVPNKTYGYSRDSDGVYHATAKWAINFETKAVGGEAVLDRMFHRGVLNAGTQIAYAFGTGMGSYRDLNIYSHGGSWAAFRTFLVHFPDQDFSVVVLGNHSLSDPYRTAYDIVELYLANELDPAPANMTEQYEADPVRVATSPLDQ